jgi:cytochrome P450
MEGTAAQTASPRSPAPGTPLAVPIRPAAGAPPADPLVGHLLQVRRGMLTFLTRISRDYGDVVPVRYGPQTVLMLHHPDLIEAVLVTQQRNFSKGRFYRLLTPLLGEGLLTAEGDLWRRQRRLAQPAFHRQRVAAYGRTMVAYTERMLAGWRPGEVRDVHADMMRLTLEIVVKTLLDADAAGEAAAVGEALPVALHELNGLMNGPAFLLPQAVPTAGKWRLGRAVRRLDGFVYKLIAERRAAPADRGDLLSMLMAAQDESGGGLPGSAAGGGMSDRQLRDEVMTIMLAGHETTALALSWTWYLLSEHPAVDARLRDELHATLGGRPPEVADLPRLAYTERVLSEAMRLYPPIPVIGRQAVDACDLGGYHVPAGTPVSFAQWSVQRDPRFFDAPDDFRPERWEDGLARRLPRFAYFPFGGGPRLCIGNAFATMEATLILATVAQRFRPRLAPGHPVVPVPALTLRPANGLRMRVDPAA